MDNNKVEHHDKDDEHCRLTEFYQPNNENKESNTKSHLHDIQTNFEAKPKILLHNYFARYQTLETEGCTSLLFQRG